MSDQLSFLETPTGKPIDLNTAKLIIKLLPQVTSLGVVSGWLKAKGLKFSAGSWTDMGEKRILPYLNDGSLSLDDVVELLANAEEFGRCHSFLYRCSKADAAKLVDQTTVEKAAKDLKVSGVIDKPIVLDQPEAPTIASIRYEREKRGNCLIVKVIERREERRFVDQNFDAATNRLTKIWDVTAVRAVNSVRLFESGLMEIRIQSYSSRANYGELVQKLWLKLAPFFPPRSFRPLSLSKAKESLLTRRNDFKGEVRFSDSIISNDNGITITAATGLEEGNLFEDKAATKSIDDFLNGGGHCDEANIWWIEKEGGLPSKDVHMLLSGLSNEFAITANCGKADFEYVLDKITSLT